jgi:hypothetical protein
MNFRNEREPDERLMALIRNLDQARHLDVLETSFGLPTLGRLNNAQRRQAFDIEFEFEQRRLLVETKVDADEAGRWEAVDDATAWQTDRIAAQVRDGDVCLFIHLRVRRILYELLEEWRASPYSQKYGRLSLYPVGRLMLPVDSVLNWFEFWRDRPGLTVGGILPAEMRALYFEACRPEFYQRQVYAVWEWDIDLPALIYKGGQTAANALGTLFDAVLPELA